MEAYPLLKTKLYIPPIRPDPSTGLRARLVSRPRLTERLNAGLPTQGGLSCVLTLISAPAGFGKTTLASEWVQELRAQRDAPQVAWVSLDQGDNDPARFLAYLIAAFQTVEASIGKGVSSALQSPQPPPAEAVLTSVINELAVFPGRILLVLDDYHLMEAEPIHDALTFLLEHMPPQMHLVIATREDPHLPLARLRAKGQLTEMRAADLRFTYGEAAEFLNRVMGLDLSAEDISALETRTEGWIAGLQMAALALQGTSAVQGHKDTSSLVKSFTGSHRFVLDYLIEEVLEQQTEAIQNFLLQTSVLDRLSGSLCDAVRFGTAKAPGSSRGTAARQGVAETPGSPSGTAVRQGVAETPGSSSGTGVRQGVAEAPRGEGSSQAILEMLERANLFIIPLDAERRWYRYHTLFSDLLRRRLRQTQPAQVLTLHDRASGWYEQNGFADEAIEHALVTEDLERVAFL
ncbi:MAG TPA: NACHT domain-containing protein, partial [Anaerolineae bacterium]|nr:NACHT domain-containing protein [Anaerolineae bacterium]